MDFVVLDFETTGLRNEDTIIEIGYVWIQDGAIKDERSTLINPGKPISRRITQITGINTAMVKDAPYLSDVINGFSKFLRGKLIVAHNASFDMRFLNNALRDAKLDPIDDYICTMRMFRAYKKEMGIMTPGAKLSDLTAFFTLQNDRAHRALEDAQVTAKAFMSMTEVLDWQKWVSGQKKTKKKTDRVLLYEEHLNKGTDIDEIAEIMKVKHATVMKYFYDWLSVENYKKYETLILKELPDQNVIEMILEQSLKEGRINRLYQILSDQVEFSQVQMVLKLKQIKLIDMFK